MPDGADNPNRMKPQDLPASERGKRARRRRSIGAMALEPRLMYDAAAATTVGQIWFTTNRIGTNLAGTAIERVGVDGSNPVDVVDHSQPGGSALGSPNGIVVDAARGKYFVVNQVANPDGSGFNNVILSGNLATGALDPTPVYIGPETLFSPSNGASITGLQIDVQSGELYFAQTVHNTTTNLNDPAQTGIFKVSESAVGATMADTTLVQQVVSLPGTTTDKVQNLALDLKDDLVFFTDNSGFGSTNSDTLGVANLLAGPNGPVTYLSATELATAGVTNTTGMLRGIAVDADNHTLYFTTQDTSSTAHNYVLSTSFTVTGSDATAMATFDTTTGITKVADLGTSGMPVSIALDVPHDLFYVANLSDNSKASTTVSGSIQAGHLDGASTQTLTMVFDASTMTDANGNPVGVTRPTNLFLDATSVSAGDKVTFTQNGPAVTADAGLTVASDQNFVNATVQISAGAFDGDTLTANTSGTNIQWSYDSTTHTLTLSGVDTAAHYQQVLETITFGSGSADPTNGGTDMQRTLTWTVNDGVVSSNATSTVMVHEAPTVVAGDTATFYGGGAPVTLDGTLTVSDRDGSGTLSSATIKIDGGFITGDTLNFTDQNGITGSYDASTGTLTLNGTASVATYQAALDSITYSFNPTNGDPTAANSDPARTITWVVNNGAAPSNAVTSTVDTVHVAPTVDAGNATATFTGGGPAVTLDGTLTVADVDSNGNLAGAKVTISSGLLSGDTLAAVTTGTNITAGYDASTGTLTLTGQDTLANYQTVLHSVTYNFPGNGDPTQGGNTTRTIGWAVYDGVAWSGSATSTLSTVNAVHTAPTLAGAGNTVPYAKHEAGVAVDSALTVSDPDSGGMLTGATVTISSGFASGDTLAAVTTGTNITASYDANTGVLTLTGQDTLANYQTVLDDVTYSSTSNDPSQGNKDSTRTITWVVNDGATNHNLSTPVTSTIDIVPELQSISHAPHGPRAFSVRTAAPSLPSLSNDTTLVTSVGSADADEHDDTNVVPWPGSERRSDRETHAAVDLRHAVTATDAELLAARDHRAGSEQRGDAPALGKPGLLTQLKAAGRHGFVTERQALLKSLQQQRPAAR